MCQGKVKRLAEDVVKCFIFGWCEDYAYALWRSEACATTTAAAS